MHSVLYTPDQIARRGEEIYEQQLRSRIDAGHVGDFLVMDILSAEYEIDKDDLAAFNRLLARRPNGVLYGLRIGYPAAYRLGGNPNDYGDHQCGRHGNR